MSLKNFIRLGRIEGISSLLLFFVAMPMKYALGMAWAVTGVGWAHGLLFTIYIGALVLVGVERKWKITSMFLLFIAAILPGGPLYLEKFILRRENEV